MWNDTALVEDVKQDVLSYLEQLYVNHSPEFIYYKTLFHIFEQGLSIEHTADASLKQTHILDTCIWQALFDFQRDGVKGGINKLLRHGGCIIANTVGLGKTFEALAIIKYFELLNYRVLVLCPKRLLENWTMYQAQHDSELNPFVRDRFGYTVLSHTDLSRDEGYSNDLKDLRNQIYFLTEGRDNAFVDTMGIASVKDTLAQPRQILDIFRALCSGRTIPDEELCELFDRHTHQGEDMSAYTATLNVAVKSIVSTFKRRAARQLQAARDAVLFEEDKALSDSSQLELITWLIIE